MDKYIHNIITESLFEDDDSEKKPKHEMSAKQRETLAKIEHAEERDGKEVGDNESQEVRNFFKNPAVNVSEIMVQATGLSPTSASSLGSKIAKGERPVKQSVAQVVHQMQNQLS